MNLRMVDPLLFWISGGFLVSLAALVGLVFLMARQQDECVAREGQMVQTGTVLIWIVTDAGKGTGYFAPMPVYECNLDIAK